MFVWPASVIFLRSASAISPRDRSTCVFTRLHRSSRCFSSRSTQLMPAGSSGEILRWFPVIMSSGAFSLKIALGFCESESDLANSRPKFSSSAKTCRPLCGPSGTIAGLVPIIKGVAEMCSPSATVKLKERWCPSNRQPQVFPGPGSPKMLMWYSSGSRENRRLDPSIFCSTSSRLMILLAFTIPLLLRLAAKRAVVRCCCGGVISLIVRSLALLWNEMPIEPVVVAHREHAGGLLLRCQRRDQVVGGGGHFVRGRFFVSTRRSGNNAD